MRTASRRPGPLGCPLLALVACVSEAGRSSHEYAPAVDLATSESDAGGPDSPPVDVGGPDLPSAPDRNACYPGPDHDWTVCLPVVSFEQPPDGYDYPAAWPAEPGSRAPVAWLDLDALDPDTSIAPGFRLGELARAWTGRYAVLQPHAVERLQALRDAVGPIAVTSGYRSPAYNAMIGGAPRSRHMYGDGFDMHALDADLGELEQACLDHDGVLVEYETHVHCDWRDDPLDEVFFGPSD